MPAVDTLQAVLDTTLLDNRGALYEAEVFSHLQASPFVIRSFEFAPADGCIDCSRSYDPSTNYADRFQSVVQCEHDASQASSRLMLFDVKSKVSERAGEQSFLTRGYQRQIVAFYIGLRAADTTFVEIIPNYDQGTSQDLSVYSAVTTSRESRLPPSAYRLDTSTSPYRMPIYMLPEAIRRVRNCAQGDGDYVNPWTQVCFSGWKPLTVDSMPSRLNQSRYATWYIMPHEDTEHFSACKAVLEIQRVVKTQQTKVSMALDFVSLQPQLADFKLLYKDPSSNSLHQVFVQHKLDVRDRSINTPLHKVSIARKKGEKIKYWFTAFERFDFLFYEFSNISSGAGRPRITEIFFLPECIIPDDFYTTNDIEASFEREEFKPYRITMDTTGYWLQAIVKIILENENKPRRQSRPNRVEHIELRKTISERVLSLSLRDKGTHHGRAAYSEIMTYSTRQFFDKILSQCAKRGSGLLFALSTEHPVGDFGFCRYQWSRQDQLDFFKSGIPPQTISDISGVTPVVPICYYTRSLECTSQGPEVSAANFRRLNSCSFGRLIVYNVAGNDDRTRPGPFIVIPSDDVGPTKAQRKIFSQNLSINKQEEHAIRTPSISALLNSGLSASAYTVGASGPLIYDSDHWSSVWESFWRFANSHRCAIEHPPGRVREAGSYLVSLSDIHKRLVEEDCRQPIRVVSNKRKASLHDDTDIESD